jgi:hypothetical protein
MTPQDLQKQAMQLSIAERWQLVQTLLASIQQETEPATTPADEPSPATESSTENVHLHPWTQSLVGILPTALEEPQACYIDYLEEKYA